MSSNLPLACASVPAGRGRIVKDWQAAGSTEHFVQFYRTDDYLVECVAGYVARGIWKGDSALVIATPAHRAALEERLRLKSVDVAASLARGQYLALDAREVLARFMVGDRPDAAAFRRVAGELIASLTKGGRALRAFGEMVALLWAEEKRDAAIELEGLWNELARDHAFTLFCAYHADAVAPKDGRPGVEQICMTHHCVIPFTA